MKLTIDLDYDVVDNLIITSLWELVEITSDPDSDPYETVANRVHSLSSLLHALRMHTTASEFEDLTKGLEVNFKPFLKWTSSYE